VGALERGERQSTRGGRVLLWHSGAVQIGILGPLEVTRDGVRTSNDGLPGSSTVPETIVISGVRLRRLLTRLAADVGHAVSARELVEAVWLGDAPREPTGALQSLISRLRRTLGDGDTLQQTPTGYRLDVAADTVDAHRFAEAAAVGHR